MNPDSGGHRAALREPPRSSGSASSLQFLPTLTLEAGSRSLHGVRLVTSDHHDGLKAAIAKAFIGATRVLGDATSEPTSGSVAEVAALISWSL